MILCGGGSKVPILQKAISDSLPGVELLNSLPADEVIAIGAAKEVGHTNIISTFLCCTHSSFIMR